MLTIYWICFIAGGFLVALAAFTGLDGIEFGTDWDLDLELRAARRWWLPVFSLKFWTFGSCFFGLTGLLFSRFYPWLSPLGVAVLALSVGLSVGTAMAWIMRILPARQVDSLIRTQDLIGLVMLRQLKQTASEAVQGNPHIKTSRLHPSLHTSEKNIQRRSMISMHRETTTTVMPPDRQGFLDHLSAGWAFLRCPSCIHFKHLNPGTFSLEFEDCQKLTPARIQHRTGQPVIPTHPSDVRFSTAIAP